jgi:hypothetical protein
LALVPLLWLATIPFIALGVAIGYSLRDEVASGISVALLFILSIGGGLWMPVQVFPHWLAQVARVLPSYRAGELSWRLLDGQQPFGSGALLFAAWLVVLLGFAGWRFRLASGPVRSGRRAAPAARRPDRCPAAGPVRRAGGEAPCLVWRRSTTSTGRRAGGARRPC